MTAEDQFVFLFTHFVKHFGGGGHTKAAACTIEADSIEFATRLVVDEIMHRWGKN